MPYHAPMQDRYGLPLTTSATLAAERFIEGMDLLWEQHCGPEDQCTRLHKACTIRYRYCSPRFARRLARSRRCKSSEQPTRLRV